MDIHPNLKLLSHSSDTLLEDCARKFQLYKLMPKEEVVFEDAIETVDLDFGKLVGIGVQEILATSDLDKAFWRMFLYWDQIIDEDAGERKKKTFWHGLFAVERFMQFRQTELADYDLVHFDGRPAIELGYLIKCPDGFSERGFFDALLQSRSTKKFATLECKTTGNYTVHEAMYKHSGQGLGYELVTDVIANKLGLQVGDSFNTIYVVYQTHKFEWHYFPFPKTHTQRALWIKTVLLRIKRVADYAEENYFPMNGGSCYKFNRPCKYFGICDMSDKALNIADLSKVKVQIEPDDKYQFKFDLIDLIHAQIEKQRT